MPISRILVLDYHASLRTSLFPKRRKDEFERSSLSLSLFLFLFCFWGGRGGDGLADRIELVDI